MKRRKQKIRMIILFIILENRINQTIHEVQSFSLSGSRYSYSEYEQIFLLNQLDHDILYCLAATKCSSWTARDFLKRISALGAYYEQMIEDYSADSDL